MQPSFAVLGVGSLGDTFVRRLLVRWFSVTGCDPSTTATLRLLGTRVASCVREFADPQALIALVATEAPLRGVAFEASAIGWRVQVDQRAS